MLCDQNWQAENSLLPIEKRECLDKIRHFKLQLADTLSVKLIYNRPCAEMRTSILTFAFTPTRLLHPPSMSSSCASLRVSLCVSLCVRPLVPSCRVQHNLPTALMFLLHLDRCLLYWRHHSRHILGLQFGQGGSSRTF